MDMTPEAVALAIENLRAMYAGQYDTLEIEECGECLFSVSGSWESGKSDVFLYATEEDGSIIEMVEEWAL